MTTDLEKVFYNDTTIKTQVGATIEYNMNSLIDNITVTSTITDTNYTSTINNWINGKPNPFKKLFPIDSIIKPFRPINSGVNYYILPPKDTPANFYSPQRVIYPTDKPRVYYPGITTFYKYWVTPVNSDLNLTVNYVNSNNTKPAMCNKIIISFDKFHALPTSITVEITYSDNSVKATTMPTFNTNYPDGKTILYPTATDTNWVSVEPATLYSLAKSIKSIKVTGVNPGGNKVIGVIEISARWIKDISSEIVTLDIQKESSSSGNDILPVGNATANTINLFLSKYDQSELQIESYDRSSLSFNSSKIYMAKNAEIKPHFKVYHDKGAIISGSDKYDKVEQGVYYVDSWSISTYGDTSLVALDGSKYLMETLCPDLLLEDYPATAILRSLLDSIGFTNYNFNVVQTDTTIFDKSIPIINYWWTSPDATVWETIQDLCRDIQMNAVFDESNVLQFYSREFMYSRITPDWAFSYETENLALPNIIDFSKEEIASANQVKILWSTPTVSNYTGSSTKLWKSSPSFLAAGGLRYDIAANTAPSNTVLILELASANNNLPLKTLYNFNGYLLIDSEIIEYDAIRYQYVPKDSTTDIAQAVWIESESDINKYNYLSKPGYQKIGQDELTYFRPTGEYRVKTRGAFGTTPAFHAASAINKLSEWSGKEVTWT